MTLKLIVFDFHGVLSLSTGSGRFIGNFEETLHIDNESFYNLRINNIKNALRKYKKDSWYQAMIDSKISPYFMMPTLTDVISFVAVSYTHLTLPTILLV